VNQRGKIKSFGVLRTATIGGIVTAAIIAVPVACFAIVMTFFRVTHHFTHNKVAASNAVQQSTAPSLKPVVQPTAVATASAGCGPNQKVGNKQGRPLRLRDALAFLVVCTIVYGILGFLLFGFWSWLYNLLSPRFGGIEIEWTDGP